MAYIEMGLHSGGPTEPLEIMPNLNTTIQVHAGFSAWVPIPLDWAGRLVGGEAAKGIYLLTTDYQMTISGPGTIRLTSF
jgi:hypothetical protein